MKPKRSVASVVLELLVVLLLTTLAFAWGRQTAWTERGYEAISGEHLLLLIPVIYYPGKRIILDWEAANKRVAVLHRSRDRPYYTICPYCGAHLDPGERCDCLDEPTDTSTTHKEDL